MGKHKRLKQYSVLADGKISKIVEFSKGEAEVFVKNFIESRLTHSVIKQFGGLKTIKAFFTDTNYMKEKLTEQLNSLIQGVNKKIEDSTTLSIGGEDGLVEQLTEEQKNALNEAKTKLTFAKENIKNVVDDSDFNKENIQSAKNYVSETLEKLVENGITSLICPSTDNSISSDDGGGLSSVDLKTENRKINNKLNTLRKWQFDIFEEEFSAELWVGTYHEYKYTKTKEELCEILNTAIKSLGADIDLKAEDYNVSGTELVRSSNINVQTFTSKEAFPSTGEENTYYYAENEDKYYIWSGSQYAKENNPELTINIETDIKNALKAKNINYKRIDIDWNDSNTDPESEGDEGFNYPY